MCFPEFRWELVKTVLKETQRCFNFDVSCFIDGLITRRTLKMSCSKLWMIVVFVPPEIHGIIRPMDSLDVTTLSRSPENFQFPC